MLIAAIRLGQQHDHDVDRPFIDRREVDRARQPDEERIGGIQCLKTRMRQGETLTQTGRSQILAGRNAPNIVEASSAVATAPRLASSCSSCALSPERSPTMT